jgi:hypothetical protein
VNDLGEYLASASKKLVNQAMANATTEASHRRIERDLAQLAIDDGND